MEYSETSVCPRWTSAAVFTASLWLELTPPSQMCCVTFADNEYWSCAMSRHSSILTHGDPGSAPSLYCADAHKGKSTENANK